MSENGNKNFRISTNLGLVMLAETQVFLLSFFLPSHYFLNVELTYTLFTSGRSICLHHIVFFVC